MEIKKELKAIERAAITKHISKSGRLAAIDGYRYRVTPKHECCMDSVDAETLPECRVYVEKRCTYETIQNRVGYYWRNIRRFHVDLMQLQGLKQTKPADNA